MSSNHDQNVDLELARELDRHIAALRDEPVGDGPSEEALAKTRAMLLGELTNETNRIAVIGRRSLMERIVLMTFAQRIAAVVMFALGGLTLYVMFALFSTMGASVAFAQVAEKLKAARTLSYDNTVTLAGKSAISTHTLVADPDRMRTEMKDGMVSIINGHTSLVLNPAAKSAMRMELTPPTGQPKSEQHSIVDALRSLGQTKGEPLGEKEIDGVPAVGFRSKVGLRTLTVWADKKTALPLRVETVIDVGGGTATVVMDHFQIDPPLDDSLFSTDPPLGYKLSTQTFAMPAINLNVEEAVVDLLREYTKLSDGAFPAGLNDWFAFIKASKGADPAEQQKIIAMAGTVTTLTSSLECGYTGKDVNLGDKEKVVFWYRKDGKPPTYRAIFGDLRVEDVEKDKLPTTQPVK